MSDLPPEAIRRTSAAGFTSGLSVDDFAACLDAGLEPVALVQGYCVMSRGPVLNGPGRPYRSVLSRYACPHEQVHHIQLGSNRSMPAATAVWERGWNAARDRMVEEARAGGADGIVGVTDRSGVMVEPGLVEFHLQGTAVRLRPGRRAGAVGEPGRRAGAVGEPGRRAGAVGEPGGIWTSFLAGARLTKLFEAGFAPVEVLATETAVALVPSCTTAYAMRRHRPGVGAAPPGRSGPVPQLADADMQVRRLARDRIRSAMGADVLHVASLEVDLDERTGEEMVARCLLRGTRVRRYKAADPMAPPDLVVTLG